MGRRVMVATAALATWAALAGPAQADGLPLTDLGVESAGVETLAGDERYVTLPAGADTVVARVQQGTANVLDSSFLAGELTVPAVAYDGSSAGLSADGGLLALIKPRRRFPRASTELALLDALRLRLRERIDLEGDFSFDAISPDGSTLFLVEYPNRRDPSVYRVRVYDVTASRLLGEPLIDSRTAAVVMRGRPLSRVTDPEGRVAYTLYDGAGEPFVHALDTAEPAALCILLPKLGRGVDPSELGLEARPAHREVAVVSEGRPVALLDTDTAKARRPERDAADDGGGSAALGLGGGLAGGLVAIAALLAGGLSLSTRRR